jgi:hypothetical protein
MQRVMGPLPGREKRVPLDVRVEQERRRQDDDRRDDRALGALEGRRAVVLTIDRRGVSPTRSGSPSSATSRVWSIRPARDHGPRARGRSRR